MVRKTIRPNINIEKLYMKKDDWPGTTVGIPLNRDNAVKLCRELLEAVEKAQNSKIELTIFPKRKTPTLTVTYIEE